MLNTPSISSAMSTMTTKITGPRLKTEKKYHTIFLKFLKTRKLNVTPVGFPYSRCELRFFFFSFIEFFINCDNNTKSYYEGKVREYLLECTVCF